MVIVTSHLVYEEKCHPRCLCHMPGQTGCQRGWLCSGLGSDGQDSPWQAGFPGSGEVAQQPSAT